MWKRLIVSVLLVASSDLLLAQEDWENDGEIEDVEIEIVKDREITLPRANRNFEKISPMTSNSKGPELTYFFSDLNLPLPSLDINIRPLRVKDEPLNKLYGNYLKAGFGNFTTPYFEGFVTSKRDRNRLYGAHVNYLNSRSGPVDGENSGSGRFDASVFGKYFGKQVTASGEGGFRNRNLNFYGYPQNEDVAADTIEQNFNNYYFKFDLENTDPGHKLQYATGLQFDYLKDNFSAEESEVQLDFRGSYELGGNGKFNLVSDLDIISQKDEELDVKTRNIFRVAPSLTFDYEGFTIDAGFNIVYENDTLGDSDELHFYPTARARYALASGFEVHAGIRGDVEKLTLRQLVNQNEFIGPNTRVFNSYKTFEFFGGIGGSLTSKIGFGAGLSIANYQNMHFFINNPEDQSKFLVTYDLGNVAVVNVHGQLTYNRNEALRVLLRGDYWGYDTDDLPEAYHRPNYSISATTTYKLVDKFRLEGEVHALGGITALDVNTGEDKSLDAVLDLNFTGEYLISEQFSAFVRLNNILSNEYELFFNYPNRGFQVMAGVTYSF